MYVDPNVGGMLFQALSAIAALGLGLIFAISGRNRSDSARIKQRVRISRQQEVIRRVKKD